MLNYFARRNCFVITIETKYIRRHLPWAASLHDSIWLAFLAQTRLRAVNNLRGNNVRRAVGTLNEELCRPPLIRLYPRDN
jgi:hypothetical protein